MKIKEVDFKNYFNTNKDNFVRDLMYYLSEISKLGLNKNFIAHEVETLFEMQGKPKPHISWATLEDIKNEFHDDKIEIITTIGNKNWVYFYDTMMNHMNELSYISEDLHKIYESKLSEIEILSNIMENIFGFIEFPDEIILIEKPERIFNVNFNGELHNISGPTIQIGSFKEYFINGDNITPKEWSKRLRMALIDYDDDLIGDININILKDIRKEVTSIDGVGVKNINEPKVFVFYLDREIFTHKDILNGFTSSVEAVFSQRNFNSIAFFLPTDTEERVECINPRLVNDEDYFKARKILEECQKLFDIGND